MQKFKSSLPWHSLKFEREHFLLTFLFSEMKYPGYHFIDFNDEKIIKYKTKYIIIDKAKIDIKK